MTKKQKQQRNAAKAPAWLRTGAAAYLPTKSERDQYRNRGNTFGAASPVRVPLPMQALVEVAKLDPKQGEFGTIDCLSCGQHTFKWLKERVSGKLNGGCTNCGLKFPRG